MIRLCKTETKLLFTWFNFVISPYAWLHVTCLHWEMSASWSGKTDNWQNVLCSYDPICAQIMAIKTWYYKNWDRYMCGFLITNTTSDCAIVEKYVSKHVNLVISGAVKTLVECNWVVSSALSARRPRPFCGPFCPVKFKTTATWAKIWLVWWQSLLISVGWSIINTSRTIYIHAFSFMIWCVFHWKIVPRIGGGDFRLSRFRSILSGFWAKICLC